MKPLSSGTGFYLCSPATDEALFKSTMLTFTGKVVDTDQKFLLKLYPKILPFPLISPFNRIVNLDFSYTGDTTSYRRESLYHLENNPV